MAGDSRPLRERPGDFVFIVGFGLFAVTSFCFDRLAALDVDFHDPNAGFFATAFRSYGEAVDPLTLVNPKWLQVMSGISAFVFGPFYLVLIAAFVRGDDRIRLPAIAYVAAMVYSVVVHVTMEFVGDVPPVAVGPMLATYTPYLLLPLALAWRMRHERPFAA